MRKALVVRKRTDNSIVTFKSANALSGALYSPYAEKYLDYSRRFQLILEKYKDAPLQKHILTDAERERIKANPDAIWDIPEYEVRGFDEAVGCSLEQVLRNEFRAGFYNADINIVEFINKTNPKYYVTIEYIRGE